MLETADRRNHGERQDEEGRRSRERPELETPATKNPATPCPGHGCNVPATDARSSRPGYVPRQITRFVAAQESFELGEDGRIVHLLFGFLGDDLGELVDVVEAVPERQLPALCLLVADVSATRLVDEAGWALKQQRHPADQISCVRPAVRKATPTTERLGLDRNRA